MAIILSHITALRYLRAVGMPVHPAPGDEGGRLYELLGEPQPCASPCFVDVGAPDAAGLVALRVCGLGGAGSPLHVLVGSTSERRELRGVCCHVHSGELPAGSLVRSSRLPDVFVSSPSLCFAQMTAGLTPGRATLLGLEMCGTFGTSASCVGGLFARPVLARASELATFVAGAAGLRGRTRAAAALPYLADGSASPMESRLLVRLSFSRRLGGYGLRVPRLNYRIPVLEEFQAACGRRELVPDLCWPDAKLALEYDSDAHHATKAERRRDASKKAILTAMGWLVLTVTPGQYESEEEFHGVALAAARRLGVRLRTDRRTFLPKAAELRDSLR